MGEIATTIARERRISPTCVHIKISGRKRVFYLYSSCPMVCCGVVSTLFLSLSSSVDFVFFLLARHSPSKLGLCSCFLRQLTSSSSSLQGIAEQARSLLLLRSSVDFVFFLLARHSPSKLGLCSCFVRQLFSGRSCRTTSAVRHISDSWRALSSFSSPTR